MWLPLAVSLAILLAVALAVGSAWLGLKWGWPAVLAGVDRHMEANNTALRADVAQLRAGIDAIPASFLDYQKEVQRIHGQAYRLVRRARKELAEGGVVDPDVEGVAADLQLVDGIPGEAPGLQPMHESVALPQTARPPQKPMTWQQRTFIHKHKLA